MSVLYGKGRCTHQSLLVGKKLEQMSFNSGAKCPYSGTGSGGVVLPDLRPGSKVNSGHLRNPSVSAPDTADLHKTNPQHRSRPVWMFALLRFLRP